MMGSKSTPLGPHGKEAGRRIESLALLQREMAWSTKCATVIRHVFRWSKTAPSCMTNMMQKKKKRHQVRPSVATRAPAGPRTRDYGSSTLSRIGRQRREKQLVSERNLCSTHVLALTQRSVSRQWHNVNLHKRVRTHMQVGHVHTCVCVCVCACVGLCVRVGARVYVSLCACVCDGTKCLDKTKEKNVASLTDRALPSKTLVICHLGRLPAATQQLEKVDTKRSMGPSLPLFQPGSWVDGSTLTNRRPFTTEISTLRSVSSFGLWLLRLRQKL